MDEMAGTPAGDGIRDILAAVFAEGLGGEYLRMRLM